MKKAPAHLLVLAVSLVCAVPRASADVGVTMTMTMNAGGTAINSEMHTRIRATKMRTDMRLMQQDASVLFDADTKQVLVINHATKEISSPDPGAMAGQLPIPMTFGDAVVSMKPTGETKELLGRLCQGYAVQMTIPMTVNADTITMRMAGTLWVLDKGPGVEEFKALSRAAAESGFSTSFMAQGPTIKGMVEVQKTMAEAGIPMSQEFSMSLEGTGPAAAMLAQMGNMVMTMAVTSFSTDPIADDAFTEPAGYTRK